MVKSDSCEWRQIQGYEGLYEVSVDGKVRSIKSGLIRKNGRSKGYLNVGLCKNGQIKSFTVHRLVAIAFHGPSHHQIRHLDGDKFNNHASNLAWGTAKENSFDRELHGRTVRGSKSKRARINEDIAASIKRMAAAGMRNRDICKATGLYKSRVSEVTTGRAWRHVVV